jgi:hypothetical protein
MRTCHYYVFFEPVLQRVRDNARVLCAVEDSVYVRGVQWRVALVTDELGAVKYLRISIPGLKEDRFSDDDTAVIQAVKEHMLSVLRITYAHDVVVFPRPLWTFADDGAEWSLDVELTITSTPARLDATLTRHLFTSSFQHREEVRLLLDGTDERIPLQYRLLSLYRLLELLFRSDGRWAVTQIDEAFAPHSARLKALGIQRRLVNYVHEVRDKCAHIRTGKGTFGVTHLNNKEATAVQNLLPIMQEVCLLALNQRAAGKFMLGQRLATIC